MSKIKAKTFEKIKKLEERLWLAETRFNRDLMNEVFAADFFEIGRSGRIYTRDEMLNATGDTIAAELPLQNFKLRYLAPEIIQATYNSQVEYNGEVEHGRRSSIWSLEEDQWVLRFHQGTAFDGV